MTRPYPFVLALALALALWTAACRSERRLEARPATDTLSPPSSMSAKAQAPNVSSSSNAAPTSNANIPDASVVRSLPTAARLRAPFRASGAHGFVAIADFDTPAQDLVVPLVGADREGVSAPVLVASFTKLWTAVATLRLVERGEVSLDDTVAKILPALASRPWSDSTLRELLTHTSRVPEFDEKGGYYRRRDIDLSNPVAVLTNNIPSAWTEKRGIFKYRNSEYALVGTILEARGGASASVILAREVFERAAMKHAGLIVSKPPPDVDLTAMGSIRPQNFFTAGAGYASAADLLAFFAALAGDRLLSAESKTLLFDGSTASGGHAIGCWAYPFSFDRGTTKLVERPGSFGNVRLFSAFFPAERRAVIAWTKDVDIPRPRTGKGIGFDLAQIALDRD